jgi:hypothetical protein
MTVVAAATVLHQAVVEISADAFAFLCAIHNSEIEHAQRQSDAHLHRLREFTRATGAALEDLPAYNANITSWRAVARLAGSSVETRSQSG